MGSPVTDHLPVGDGLAEVKAWLERETENWSLLETIPPIPAHGVSEADGSFDPFQLDAELTRLSRMRERWDELFGHLAMLLRSCGFWRDMQYLSFAHYCDERLGMAVRTVSQRIALARKLYDLPALREAMREGRLSYEKAKLVARCATESDEGEWIARAERLPCISLAREVDALDECLRRVAQHFIDTWRPQLEQRNTVQKRVLARDRDLCQVPGCSRAALHVHHVRFRSRGGDDAPENLTSLCAAHHLHGIHRGFVRVAGHAPHALRWGFRGGTGTVAA